MVVGGEDCGDGGPVAVSSHGTGGEGFGDLECVAGDVQLAPNKKLR